MDLDFDNALDDISVVISGFDLNSFARKDIAHPKVQHVLTSVLFSKSVKDMDVKFNMTIKQKTVLDCLQVVHAQDFLLAITIDGLCQHISPIEYLAILKYWL